MFNYERLHKRRIAMGMTLEEVGNIVGISRSAVQKYEKNIIKNIYISTVEAFASALNCSPAYLLGWTDDPRIINDVTTFNALSFNEKDVISSFRKLNDEGQEKAITYVNDLVDTGKYKKSDSNGLVQKEA